MLCTGAHAGSLAAELIKQAEQWLLILLVYIQIWHSFTSNKRCAPGLTQRRLRHVAWVPGAKVSISTSPLSVWLCVPASRFQSVTGGQLRFSLSQSCRGSPSKGQEQCGREQGFGAWIPRLLVWILDDKLRLEVYAAEWRTLRPLLL